MPTALVEGLDLSIAKQQAPVSTRASPTHEDACGACTCSTSAPRRESANVPSAFETTAVPTLMTTRRAFDRFSRSGGTSESLSQARAEPTGNEFLPEGVLTMCRTSGAFMRQKLPIPRSTSGPGLPLFKFNIRSTPWPLVRRSLQHEGRHGRILQISENRARVCISQPPLPWTRNRGRPSSRSAVGRKQASAGKEVGQIAPHSLHTAPGRSAGSRAHPQLLALAAGAGDALTHEVLRKVVRDALKYLGSPARQGTGPPASQLQGCGGEIEIGASTRQTRKEAVQGVRGGECPPQRRGRRSSEFKWAGLADDRISARGADARNAGGQASASTSARGASARSGRGASRCPHQSQRSRCTECAGLRTLCQRRRW